MKKIKLCVISFMFCFVSCKQHEEKTDHVMSVRKLPNKIVALTFDDSCVSHATYVAPLLKKLKFGATFFITEGFSFDKDKKNYMTWKQIKKLHEEGFEIGNHTKTHSNITGLSAEKLIEEVRYIENKCKKHEIPKPISFCYPLYACNQKVAKTLFDLGYKYARTKGQRSFDLKQDNALMMPHLFDSKPPQNFKTFKEAMAKHKTGCVSVITFHGVPDNHHPWVTTSPELFEQYMNYLKKEGFVVIALRDIAKYETKS